MRGGVETTPAMTLSEWADRYRVLSAESSAEPGRWHTDKAPYQREIMDAIGDPHIRKVVIMSAAQIGKTDAFILNPLGYYMDYAPAPILVMQPTLDMGQTFSKDRLAPMIRDTPELRDKIDVKSRYSGNTIMKKNFPAATSPSWARTARPALPAALSRCCWQTRLTATRQAPERRATRFPWPRSDRQPLGQKDGDRIHAGH